MTFMWLKAGYFLIARLQLYIFSSECITSQLVTQKLVTVEMIIMSLKIVVLEKK